MKKTSRFLKYTRDRGGIELMNQEQENFVPNKVMFEIEGSREVIYFCKELRLHQVQDNTTYINVDILMRRFKCSRKKKLDSQTV